MAGRHARSAAACAAIAATWGAVARAQIPPAAAPSPIRVAWTAPEGCPQRAVVEGEIARLLGAPPRADAGRTLDVDGKVTASGAGYSLDLATRDGTGAVGQRTIAGASCDALANAAALVVALGWDPEAVAAARAAPAEPTPPAPPASPPVPPAPAPPPPAAPPPAPPVQPVPGPFFPGPALPREREPIVELGFSAALDAGGLPGVTPGVEGGGALLLGPWRVGLRLAGFPSSTTYLDGDAERGGELSQVFGVASFGRALLPWRGGRFSHELSVHAGVEAGATFATGFGVDNTNQATVPWFAPRFEVAGRLGFPGFPGVGLRATAGAAIPVDARDFVLEDLGVLHSIAPVVGRFTAGLDVRF